MPAIKACSTRSMLRGFGTFSRATAILRRQGHRAGPVSAARCLQHQDQVVHRNGGAGGLNDPGHVGSIPRSTGIAAMSTAAAAAAGTMPRFSAGSDEEVMLEKLQPLLSSSSSAAGGGRWTLIPNGQGLERSFKFKTFAKTWDFMTAVALQCKLKNHHPEWSNVYNTTFIRWTTHSPPGLSALDVELAAICDGLARDFGEIVEDVKQSDNSCSLGRQLADTVASGAGDCCVPKPKANPKTQS